MSAKIDRIAGLPAFLRANILGQDDIIEPVCEVLADGEFGLSDPDRPKGSFLFLGPTGTGKTELTRLFTGWLHNGPAHEKLIRLDMSEYQTQESLAVLLGGSLGERGTLGIQFNRVGGSGTLLLDEIEKAHPRVLDLCLQINDAARITLARGETLDLSQFYVVMTSNIASAAIQGMRHSTPETIKRFVERQAMSQLRPEIFARIGCVSVFNPLSFEIQVAIAAHMVAKEVERLNRTVAGAAFSAGPDVVPFCVERGFHPRLGARPMRGTVEKALRRAVRECLMAGQPPSGLVGVTTGGEMLEIRKNLSPPKSTIE